VCSNTAPMATARHAVAASTQCSRSRLVSRAHRVATARPVSTLREKVANVHTRMRTSATPQSALAHLTPQACGHTSAPREALPWDDPQ